MQRIWNIKNYIIFAILSCVFSFNVIAQSTYQYGILPAVNLNVSLKNDWKLNAKIESRQEFKTGFYNASSKLKYNYILTDYIAIFGKKVGPNKTLSGGYLMRFRNGNVFHRSIQQFSITQKLTSLRLGHRISTDQTFAAHTSPVWRFRYRISAEIPLSGQTVDPKEWYLKLNNEYLNIFESDQYDLEFRFSPLLGFELNDAQKIEWGIDYRLDSFLNDSPNSKYWLSINWFISI